MQRWKSIRKMYTSGIIVALERLGKSQEALDALDTALAIDPNFALAWSNKGITLKNLGRGQEAADAFNKSSAMNKF